MKRKDIKKVVKEFDNLRTAEHRYASFDYCYSYFHTQQDLTKDMEKSCLELTFFLASWGMYCRSAFIMQKSAKHFVKAVEYISSLEKSVWTIDVDKYDAVNMERLLEIYRKFEELVVENKYTSKTVVTKIMLGVFGFVPAYDDNFCRAFSKITGCGFSSFNKKSLQAIKDFYDCNRADINELSSATRTYDFSSGKKINLKYPKAKIIDMYGWVLGSRL